MVRLLSLGLAAAVASTASATLTNTIVQVNATSSELTGAGYSQVGSGPFVSYQSGECAVNGCFTLAGTASASLPAKGFMQFQFQDFINSTTYYNGLYTVLDLSYAAGYTRAALITAINAETGATGVAAMTPELANNAAGSCSFNQWLPTDLQDSVILNWMPTPGPTTSGLSQVFTVAWNFTGVGPGFVPSGITMDAVYSLPSPGALSLAALAGLAGRRRRR
jgi:hypothetical protein